MSNETVTEAPAEENPLAMYEPEVQEAIRSWKRQGIDVNVVTIGVTDYFFRSFNRREWLTILANQEQLAASGKVTPAKLQSELEEGIVRLCLLLPRVDMATVKELPGGDVSTLSQNIMEASGFVNTAVAKKL